MLWGRDSELEILKRLLGERIPSGHTTRLYLVAGESGMGKTALVREIFEFLRTLPRPMIIVNPVNWVRSVEADTEKILMDSIECVGFDKPEVMDEEGFGGYWQRLLAETVGELPGVLIIVDSYEGLSVIKKSFLRDNVIAPLRVFNKSHDARYLVASASDITPVELETIWGGISPQRFGLGPIGPTGLREWLRAAREPVEELQELEVKTHGVPSKVEEYIRTKREQRAEAESVRAETTILKGLDDKKRRTACLAAMVDTINVPMLDYFLGPKEGMAAYAWLSKDSNLGRLDEDEGFRMFDEPRALLRIYFAQREPAAYTDVFTRVQGLKTISENFSGSRDRKILGNLALLKNFTPDLIREIMGDSAEEVNRYLKNHMEFFDLADDVWSLKSAYAQAGNMAAELIPQEERERMLSRVSELWQKRRETIFKEMEENERGVVEDRELLAKTATEIDAIEPRLMNLAAKIQQGMRMVQPKTNDVGAIQESWNLAGIVVVVLGVLWIYVGVLTVQGVSLMHCFTGAFLILVGLSAPHMGRTHAVVAAAAPVVPELPPEVVSAQRNLHFLKMQQSALDYKRRTISSRIVDRKHKIEKLENALQKPYLQ